MSATPQKASPLSRRTFAVTLVPAGTTPLHSRHLKRIHVAAEILKAAKICAGDALVVRAVDPTAGLESLSLEESAKAAASRPEPKFAIGIAWPSFTLSGTALALSPLLLANAGLSLGASVSISTLETSGITVAEADRVTLIYDSKGKAGVDSFFEAYAKEVLVDIKYIALHHFVELTFNGIVRRLLVSLARPAGTHTPSPSSPIHAYTVSRSTTVTFKPPIAPLPRKRAPAVVPAGAPTKDGELPGYESIGGMESQIEQIRELVEWPLTRPELYQHFGLRPPRGILLYGPPGTGKTLLALSIARSTRSTLLTINGPSLSSAYHGETEARLREVFAEAKRKSPAVIVIDEVDALAPNREEGGEVERRVVATLLMLMDGLEDKEEPAKVEGAQSDDEGEEKKPVEKPRVVVIAATNRLNAIDPALRRPGRFDKEIEIGVPDAASRLSILRVLLRQTPHELSEVVLQSVAARTHGFVGADISSLVHTAGLSAIKRSFALFSSLPASASPDLTTMRLNEADLETALLSTRPSAMREVFLETPKVYWNDIGGQDHIKARLRECVEWPLLHPETFKRLGVRPPRGILLYGPPGCSKTLIAKALATEGGLNFIAVKGPEVFNKYVGESEKAIRELFRKARAAAPSIVFLDEVDALAPARGSDESGGSTGDRVLMSLLTEMDGIEELNGVIVLAATNRPEVIDPALMRPGRLDRILYVSPPDLQSRKDIFRVNFAKMAVHEDVDIDQLALMTDGCSGAELVSICQDAALNAMNENLEALTIGKEHLLEAARTACPPSAAAIVLGFIQAAPRTTLARGMELPESVPLVRRRSSQSSRLALRSRRKVLTGLALAFLAVATLAWTVASTIRLAGRRRAARGRRSLVGFSASRLAAIPSELQASHPPAIHDLLAHPLLSAPKPVCAMSKTHAERYEPLHAAYGNGRHRRATRSRPLTSHDKPRHTLTYFVALNLHSSATVLPSLIHTLHALFSALGPERFTVSIYENGSKDATPAQLYLFAKLLDRLGVGHTIVSSTTPKLEVFNERIRGLAELRNLALKPLYSAPPGTWDRVLFLNDVHLCETEIKELMLQHEVQGPADMSCGMDYKELVLPELGNWTMAERTLFYDLWISRDMAGLPFYKIKYPTGDWELPSQPLPHSNSRSLFQNLLPFQVYSCFNGITIIDAALFHAPHSLRFRAEEGSDIASECFLLCRDIWHTFSGLASWGGKKKARGAKIQVVPRVSVGYEVPEFDVVRKDANLTGLIDTVEPGAREARELVRWQRWAPKLVASYPFGHWNEEAWIPPF